MREIRTEIEIDAPIERVWEVLTRFEDFDDWNPFIVHAERRPRLGERLVVTVRPPGREASTFHPTVVAYEPHRELRCLGRLGVPDIFDGDERGRQRPGRSRPVRVTHAEGGPRTWAPFDETPRWCATDD
jgi:hypothetical protein